MALGKYSRIDNRRSMSSYCSTVTVFVFVAVCLVGIWMMTSSSVVPVPNVDEISQTSSSIVKDQISPASKESGSGQFEDNPGDLPDDATKGDSNENEARDEHKSGTQDNLKEQIEEKPKEKSEEGTKSDDESDNGAKDGDDKNDDSTTEETKSDANEGTSDKQGNVEVKLDENEKKSDAGGSEGKSDEGNTETKSDKDDNETKSDKDDNETKSDKDDSERKSNDNSSETNKEKVDDRVEEKVEQSEKSDLFTSGEKQDDSRARNQTMDEIFPSSSLSELLNETMSQNVSFSTQAKESRNEKEAQLSSNKKTGYSWKLCNTTARTDFIPCLDNWQAIRRLRSTKHYEHRERHCPQEPPTCLVPLPEGYKQPIKWPKSREKVWFNNVPHTKLADYKGHQNWVKVTGEFLTFPGGGTQFKHGALHYIDFIQESVPEIAWGKRSRVILDVGCGVASFGGFLFDRDVLAMSFAPKDEHEAQVQFALERGIPAISAVMGTQRLPFPGSVFDIVHCARCRVPWHIEGGKLLLELNRVVRPGGFFVWSATPVYQKRPEDVGIWKAMNKLTENMCWELVSINKDKVNGVGVATFRKPTSNKCYDNRLQQEPAVCSQSDDPNAAWKVPLQACMHKVPVDKAERGSQWPEQWPVRLEKPPYWLSSSQVGVYGKAAPEDFTLDFEHWKRMLAKSYLNGMGINWSSVRNVMDMKAVYGGFAAALRDLKVWVMNVVPIDTADTLPIIYERGLFGIYHDWCESFSTYPRSYDLLHADHLFSKIKTRCNLLGVIAEVDRILRPEGKLIVRDNVETINELEAMVRSMQWEVHMTYSKDNEGLLCVRKAIWRPSEVENIAYAIV